MQYIFSRIPELSDELSHFQTEVQTVNEEYYWLPFNKINNKCDYF